MYMYVSTFLSSFQTFTDTSSSQESRRTVQRFHIKSLRLTKCGTRNSTFLVTPVVFSSLPTRLVS